MTSPTRRQHEQVRERGIIMTGASVRAILVGRKTQMRRALSDDLQTQLTKGEAIVKRQPRQRGIRWDEVKTLWVRERFLPDPSRDDDAWDDNHVTAVEWDGTGGRFCDIPAPLRRADNCIYAADDRWQGAAQAWLWRSPIHMPRWASRLTLSATDVRVERLQDISEADAIAEGLQLAPGGWWSGAEGQAGVTPRAAYALLWNSIHGPGAWDANPWVCSIEFQTHHANINNLEIT